jgi:hypothetical protein
VPWRCSLTDERPRVKKPGRAFPLRRFQDLMAALASTPAIIAAVRSLVRELAW